MPESKAFRRAWESGVSQSKSRLVKLYLSSLPARMIEKENRASKEAFIAYMADMCERLGLTGTRFEDATGICKGSVSCARDEVKMALAVAGNPIAMDIWSTHSRAFEIRGIHRRTIHVTSNVFADWLSETTYKRLGGKGGTFPASYARIPRKAICALHDVGGVPVALAIMGKGDRIAENIVDCTKELCGMMAAKLSGGTPFEGKCLMQLREDGGSYAAVPLPDSLGAYPDGCAAEELLMRDLALMYKETEAQIPASTTKIMTLLCVLSVVSDLQETIQIDFGDIKKGSGSAFRFGDRLTIEDALRIMMTESSNTMAEAVCRVVGRKLRKAGTGR